MQQAIDSKTDLFDDLKKNGFKYLMGVYNEVQHVPVKNMATTRKSKMAGTYYVINDASKLTR